MPGLGLQGLRVVVLEALCEAYGLQGGSGRQCAVVPAWGLTGGASARDLCGLACGAGRGAEQGVLPDLLLARKGGLSKGSFRTCFWAQARDLAGLASGAELGAHKQGIFPDLLLGPKDEPKQGIFPGLLLGPEGAEATDLLSGLASGPGGGA